MHEHVLLKLSFCHSISLHIFTRTWQVLNLKAKWFSANCFFWLDSRAYHVAKRQPHCGCPGRYLFSPLIRNNDHLLVMCHNACNSQTEDVGLCTLIGENCNFFNDFTNILMLNRENSKWKINEILVFLFSAFEEINFILYVWSELTCNTLTWNVFV